MPPPRKRPGRGRARAVDALIGTAPVVTRWLERLLARAEPHLTVAQYLALRAVESGDVLGADLARRAAVSPAAVSQLVGALELAGLVERRRLADDRRRQPLALTPQGAAALAAARAELHTGLGPLVADLPPPEAAALARLLERLDAALAGTEPPPHPPRPHPR